MTMKIKTVCATLATLAATAIVAFSASAQAADTQAISAQNAWVRLLPNNLPAAGYVTLANSSDKPIDLIGVSSPDYGNAMLHQTVSNGSTQKMVHVDKATVPAHGQLAISPGSYHVMLTDAKRKIATGEIVHVKLQFSDGETLDAPFAVKPPTQTK
jgi:copper(I)-binding protein